MILISASNILPIPLICLNFYKHQHGDAFCIRLTLNIGLRREEVERSKKWNCWARLLDNVPPRTRPGSDWRVASLLSLSEAPSRLRIIKHNYTQTEQGLRLILLQIGISRR